MRTQLPEWMRHEFAEVRAGPTLAVVRNDFAASFDRQHLIDCPRAPLVVLPREGQPGGRGPVRIVPAGPLGEAVVRRCRRGGLVEKFNRHRYFLGNRAFAELVTTHRLRRRGAPVPEALAAVQTKGPLGYTACMVTRRIPRAQPAAAVLAGAPDAMVRSVLAAIGRSIRQFHEAGGMHADLNAFNILVSEDEESVPFVIDLDRGSVGGGAVSAHRARQNLRRLHRSFRKLELERALQEWDELERAYEALPDPLPAA